ncbi:uncharacterized protein F5891DRAFT_1183383 [Suillus fuscotomentosus]|uniref:Fungal-type protein kinase domain-containing protein n=1 Tax=Suillus fuscotomentosus TaxID=1912939 RepID=A0AAD4EG44_9AGAM|nr:uncharacterized protein F5891DRAFT_1183383 [Suillus fuscotomentosus]KAG1905436.1 hypothetical protein F5891DRAFT_1183383 [Suillus fuscotomentosus]
MGPVRLTEMLGTHPNLAHKVKGWVKDNHNKTYSIMEVLWKSRGLFCCGTVCYRIIDEAGNQYALKDCWVTEEKGMHKTTILEMVKGIPNVVKLIDHWDVYYEGEPDCTACICSQYDMDHQDDLMFRDRFHCCILLSPCGEPLSKFSSRRELLTAFHAFVVAHHMMIEKQVLHGDLSPNNFVVHDGIGYFIDFDHALILAEGMTSTYLHGTGTMPYISIRILQAMLDLAPLEVGASISDQDADPNNVDNLNVDNIIDQAANALQDVEFDTNLIEHWPSDDLESLFYIFFEFIAKYGGPHGQLAPTLSRQSLLWASTYEALGNADTHLALSMICFVKMGVLMQGIFLVTKTSEYFAEFRPLMQKWGTMVYNANMPQNQVEMTHAGVLNLLNVFMRSIGEEPPPSGQSQSLHPCTAASQSLHSCTPASHALHTHPAGPSKHLPRCSTHLSRSSANPLISSTALSEPSSSHSPQQQKNKRTTQRMQ